MTDRQPLRDHPLAAVETQKVEQRLLWAERMEALAALTAGLTHALSNLLASTSMSIDLVLRADPAGPHAQLLTSLQAMTREGLDMVRQLMSIARGVEGRPVEFQVQYLLVELQRLLAFFMPSVTVVTDYPDDLWPLEGDPHRFVQLVLALCLEVRQRLPSHGALNLSAANLAPQADAAGRHIVVQVTARQPVGAAAAGLGGGRGAPPAAPRVRPAGAWLAERPACSAAALAMALGGSYEEMPPHGGGGGARVVLAALRRAPEPDAPAGEPPRGGGASVVIYEDETLLAQALAEVLAGHGYSTRVAPRPSRPPAPAAPRAAGDPPAIALAAASLDAAGRWLLPAGVAGSSLPLVLMIDAETADRLDTDPPPRERGARPAALVRKPFTAREVLVALAVARAAL